MRGLPVWPHESSPEDGCWMNMDRETK